ncbi:MAG TPA: TolC family protein [Anaeromyxobacteraceae bacterium]|nr:TolC family protein [Anaeromyxobacteraceae bacterium]
MTRGARLLLVACLAAHAAGAAAEVGSSPDIPAAITLADALRIARERAPDRAIADAAVSSAQAQVRVAGALPNPAASFMVGWSSQCDQAGCGQPIYSAGLGDQGLVAFLVTGQRGLAVDAAEHALRGATSTRRDVERNLDFQVKQQFVTTAVAARAVEISRQEAALAGQTVELARRRRDSGAISDADVARLEVLAMQIEQLVDRAVQGMEQARASLAQQMGLRAGAPAFSVVPGPTATALPPSQLAEATLETLTSRAKETRPDLVAVRAQLDAARSQASLARRLAIPQFQLQAQYQQQGNATGGWFTPPTASVGLSLPLPILYQQQGQIGQADAAVSAAEWAVAKIEAQIVAEVSTAYTAYRTSRASAERAERRLLPRSADARKLVETQYQKGAASLLDYLDAQRTHLTNEIDYLAALASFWTAVFQLEQAVGASYVP